MDSVDLSMFRYGGANMTGFSLVDRRAADRPTHDVGVRRDWTRRSYETPTHKEQFSSKRLSVNLKDL